MVVVVVLVVVVTAVPVAIAAAAPAATATQYANNWIYGGCSASDRPCEAARQTVINDTKKVSWETALYFSGGRSCISHAASP